MSIHRASIINDMILTISADTNIIEDIAETINTQFPNVDYKIECGKMEFSATEGTSPDVRENGTGAEKL